MWDTAQVTETLLQHPGGGGGGGGGGTQDEHLTPASPPQEGGRMGASPAASKPGNLGQSSPYNHHFIATLHRDKTTW